MTPTRARTQTRQGGHTIIELVIVGTLLSLFAVILLGFTWQQRAVERKHAATTHDLLSARRAVDRIVADLRHATAVDPSPDGMTIRTDDGEIRYVLTSGRLVRRLGSSSRRIASGIAELGCWQQGPIAHLRLVLLQQMKVSGHRQQPAIETSVALHLVGRKERTG